MGPVMDILNAISVVPSALASAGKEGGDLIGLTDPAKNDGASFKDFFDQLGFGDDDIKRYGIGDYVRDRPRLAVDEAPDGAGDLLRRAVNTVPMGPLGVQFDSTPEAGPGYGNDLLGQLVNTAQNVLGDPGGYTTGIVGEVALDPLTWLSGGGSKSVDIAGDVAIGAVRGSLDDAARGTVRSVAEQAAARGGTRPLEAFQAFESAADDVARRSAGRELVDSLRALEPDLRFSHSYRPAVGLRAAGSIERAPSGQALVDVIAERGTGVVDDAVLKADIMAARRQGIAGVSDPAKYGLARGYTYRLPGTVGKVIDAPNFKTGPLRLLTRKMDDGGLIGDGLLWLGTKFKGSTSRLNEAASAKLARQSATAAHDNFYNAVLTEQGRRLLNSVATKHESSYLARLSKLVDSEQLKAGLFRGDVRDPGVKAAWNQFASAFEEAASIEARRRGVSPESLLGSSEGITAIRQHLADNSQRIPVKFKGKDGVDVVEEVATGPYASAYMYQVAELLSRNPDAPWRLAEIAEVNKAFKGLSRADRALRLFGPAQLAHVRSGSNIIGQAEALSLWDRWFPGQVFRHEGELTRRFLDEVAKVADTPDAVAITEARVRSPKQIAETLYDHTQDEIEASALAARVTKIDERLKESLPPRIRKELLDEKKLLIEQQDVLNRRAAEILNMTSEEAQAVLHALDTKDLPGFADELEARSGFVGEVRAEFVKRLQTAREMGEALHRHMGVFGDGTDPGDVTIFMPDKLPKNPGKTGLARHRVVPLKDGAPKFTGEADEVFSVFRAAEGFKGQLRALGFSDAEINVSGLVKHRNPSALLDRLLIWADDAVDTIVAQADIEIGNPKSLSAFSDDVLGGIPGAKSTSEILNAGPVNRMRWATKALLADTVHAAEATTAIDYMLTRLDSVSERLATMKLTSDPVVVQFMARNPDATVAKLIDVLTKGAGIAQLEDAHSAFLLKVVELDPNIAQARLFAEQRARMDSPAHARVAASLDHLSGLQAAAETLSGKSSKDVVAGVQKIVDLVQRASSFGVDVPVAHVEREAGLAWSSMMAVMKEVGSGKGAWKDLDLWLNKTADDLGSKLYEFGGAFLPQDMAGSEVAKQVMGTFRFKSDMGGLFKFMHEASGVWRSAATMTPSFSPYNYLGGLAQMFGGGVSVSSIRLWHKYSPMAIAATVDEVENLLPMGASKLWGQIPDEGVRAAMKEVWSHGVADVSLMRSVGGTIEGQIDMSLPLRDRTKQAYRLAREEGKRVGAYAETASTLFHGVGTKFDRMWANSFDRMWRVGHKSTTEAGRIGGWELIAPSIEGHLRGSTMLDRLLKNESTDQALLTTLRMHIDYSDLTHVDRWMNEIFPFWTWRSRSMAYQVSYAMRHPYWYGRRYGAYRDSQDRNNVPFTPAWAEMGTRISTPITLPGAGQIGIVSPDPFNETYAKIDLLQSDEKQVKDKLVALTIAEGSPIWRAGLEWASNTTVEGIPLQSRGDPKSRIPGPKPLNRVVGSILNTEKREDGWYYADAGLTYVLTENLPLLAQMDRLSNDRGGDDPRPDRTLLASWLGYLGFRTANVNERSQWGEKQREINEARGVIRELKRQGY